MEKIFPYITTHNNFFNEVKQFLGKNKFFAYKDFIINDENFRTYFYVIQPSLTLFNINIFLKELRGITFSLDRNIVVSRPLHKFFNIEEHSFSKSELNKVFNNIVQIQTKLDGSMIHPFLLKDGNIEWKTKKSHLSEVAISFKDYIKEQRFYKDFINFNKNLLNKNLTPIYEFYSDKNKIVIEYKKPFAKLLAIRHNFTGEYVEFENISELRKKIGYFDNNIFLNDENIPTRWNYNINEIMSIRNNLKNFEGFILVTKNSERYKVKTQWYFENHRILTGYSEKIVLLSILENKYDDLYSKLKSVNDKEKINEAIRIKNIFDNYIDNILEKIIEYNNQIKNFDRKNRAIWLNKYIKEIDVDKKIIFNFCVKNENPSKIEIINMIKKLNKKFVNYFISQYLLYN